MLLYIRLFIIFSFFLNFSAIISYAQEDAYYDEAGYEYDEEGEYTEDTTYADAGYEEGGYADDATYTGASYEEGEYADNTSEAETPPVEKVTPATSETSSNSTDTTSTAEANNVITNIYIPLFQTYRSPNIVDGTNLTLPGNHRLVRARGSVWRSDNTVLQTNRNGVVSEQRLFIFFDRDRDAISYEFALARERDIPAWPQKSSFIPLLPLLQTNSFIPVPKASINSNERLSNTIRYMIKPEVMKTYDYENALNKLIESQRSDSKDYKTIHTNVTFITNKIERPFVVLTNDSVLIETNITSFSSETTVNIESGGSTNTVSIDNSLLSEIDNANNYNDSLNSYQYDDVQNDTITLPPISSLPELPGTGQDDAEYGDYTENVDNVDQEYVDYYENYSGSDENLDNLYDVYGQAKYIPQRMFAQEISQKTEDEMASKYVVNFGGDNGGVFIHETGDIDNPYRVIFLSLDQGIYLYEYNINSSFDARNDKIRASAQARDLYKRILDERINMKRFKRVRLNKTFIGSY